MNWQSSSSYFLKSFEDLTDYENIAGTAEPKLKKIIERHPLRISSYYANLINWDDPDDPLKKMVVPSLHELNLSGSYDTSGEQSNTKLAGLQHKYSQTALIIATNNCASYCRFCFRKRLVGLNSDEVVKKFEDTVGYIKKHKEINNVLVSGGDPLILKTKWINKFLRLLSDINHLDFIRIGSKVPIYLPHRILDDQELLNVLDKYSLPNRRLYIVTQINHPREITDKLVQAISQLQRRNIIINNQTVLMKDINDEAEVMAKLQNRLVAIGINPYYVFQCRPVKRVKKYFQVPLFKGYNLIEEAKKLMNGHSKRFKYIMSHKKGKIETMGIQNNRIYFKFHQAMNPRNLGKFFSRKLDKSAGWLDEL